MALSTRVTRIITTMFSSDSKTQRGFTLIELLVVILMLGILMIGLIFTFNPLTQINKAQDTKRQHDLGQIQRALDTYFNDTGCYPTSIPFGKIWKSASGQVYMQTVPQDPQCATSPNVCYVYMTDTSLSCPQWNVLFGAMRGPIDLPHACPLTAKNSSSVACLPSGYSSSGYNYCLLSGNVDCSSIVGSTIGGQSGGSGTITPTPTPTPGQLTCSGNAFYACTSKTQNNPNGSCNSIGLVNGVPTQCSGYGGTETCVCASNCAGLPCAF